MKYLILTLFLLSRPVLAEFYVWYDDNGIKHVSTHPEYCQNDGLFNSICQPITANSKMLSTVSKDPIEKRIKEEQQSAIRECNNLKKKRDALSKKLDNAKTSIRKNVYNMNAGSIISAPFALVKLQEEMLAADKEYDKCFGKIEANHRINERNKIRTLRSDGFEKSAEIMRHSEQDRKLESINDDVKDIKNRLDIR